MANRTTLTADTHGAWNAANPTTARIVAHHDGVMGGGSASAVTSAEVRFGEPVGA